TLALCGFIGPYPSSTLFPYTTLFRSFEAAVLGEIADVVSAVFEALAFRTDGTDRGPARDDAGEARRVAVPRHPKRSCSKPGQAESSRLMKKSPAQRCNRGAELRMRRPTTPGARCGRDGNDGQERSAAPSSRQRGSARTASSAAAA